MHYIKKISFSFLTILLYECSQPLPELKDVDLIAWKADRNACLKKRSAQLEPIREQKKLFLGLSEVQTVRLLGAPDRNELYSHNQKFYYYFLEPSPECTERSNESPKKLVIRFNATGVAQEVTIE